MPPRSLEGELEAPDTEEEEAKLAVLMEQFRANVSLYEHPGWALFQVHLQKTFDSDATDIGLHGLSIERTEYLRGRMSVTAELLNLPEDNATAILRINERFAEIERLHNPEEGSEDDG